MIMKNHLNIITNLITVPLLLFLFSPVHARQNLPDDELIGRAKRILEEVPLIDGHNDVPIQYRNRAGYKLSQIDLMNTSELERPMHTDIPRLREGRVGGQFWSVYVSPDTPESESVQATMEQIDFVYRMIEHYPDHLELALTADDIEQIFHRGKIASLIGMEGGHSIGNSLAVLRMFYNLGARYMGLTHSRTIDWADSATDDPASNGLSEFGEEVVREMNRLGMLVDLSHVSHQTMVDAIQISSAPVIFSHSSAAGVTDHPRNVPDDVLQMVRENNGLVMVTFVPAYVSEELRVHLENRSAEIARLRNVYPNESDTVSVMIRDWESENPAPKATLSHVADHIDYIRELIGSEYIGIGGDYDGIRNLPDGLADVSTYPALFAELLGRGYTETELKNIAGLNLLRVLRKAEEVSRQLKRSTKPSEMLFGSNPDPESYPNSHLLINAADLYELQKNESLLVIDARSETGDSLIPGAVHFPAIRKLTDPDHEISSFLVGPQDFETLMRSIGLNDSDQVVIYDEGNSLASARLFYALDYYGFTSVSILNGGIQGWIADGLPLSPDGERSVATGDFTIDIQEDKFCSFEYLIESSGNPERIIFDARSASEYEGTDQRAAFSGHIPNAVNLEWNHVLHSDGIPFFLPSSEIRKQYTALGITPDKEIIPHCHTNVRGSHAYFTLRLMGFDSVRAYEGSWSEYGNREDAIIQRP
jgi:membrane dipeptidase